MSQIKPFPFERLPHYSQKEAHLLQDLLQCLPRLGFSQKLSTHISHLLTKELGESVSIKREKIDFCSRDDLMRRLSPHGVFLSVGLNPSPDKMIVELDSFLSFLAIDKLLGGTGEFPQSLRGLTEIEEGVLSFAVMKVLSMIFEKSGTSARFHFRLESIVSESGPLKQLSEGVSHYAMLYFKLSLGKKSGFVKLYVPQSLVESQFLADTQADEEYMEARIKNYEDIPSEIWAELGHVSLMSSDLNQLESGDVILLNPSGVQLKSDHVVGMIPLRVGLGQSAYLKGRIIEDDSQKMRIRVEGVQSSDGGSDV